MPLSLIRNPNHSPSVFANLHFRSFKETFDMSNFFKIFSTNAICSTLVALDAIKISSMKAFA